MGNKERGFGYSLIELTVVVCIIGLLTAMSIPAYNSYMMIGRRSDAQQYLMQQAMMLERNFTRLGRYPAADDFALQSDDYYTFTYAPGGATTFTLSAEPTGTQAADDCGTMTIDQKGHSTASVATCWR